MEKSKLTSTRGTTKVSMNEKMNERNERRRDKPNDVKQVVNLVKLQREIGILANIDVAITSSVKMGSLSSAASNKTFPVTTALNSHKNNSQYLNKSTIYFCQFIAGF